MTALHSATAGTSSMPRPIRRTVCTLDGCDRQHLARGLCAHHYGHARRRGDLERYTTQSVGRSEIAGEEWRPIPGYEGKYEVSSLGRVYRCKEAGVRYSGHLLRPGTRTAGYLAVNLYGERGRTLWPIHQIVLLAFVGPRPSFHTLVRHLDGNPQNNRRDNLAYGTPAENMQDTLRHGTHAHAFKTHCPRGHPYNEANTYIQPSDGGRKCRTCKERRAREWWAVNGEARNARRRAQ